MQVEIYIDGNKMDVFQDTKISETKQINDFFEIKDRQTSYTNTFKLPRTERNKSILSGHGLIGVTSMFPYRKHEVTIYRDGIPTVNKGLGYLKDTSDTFNLYVYSENIDLFEKIKDRTLAELDFSTLSHELNIDNWIDSFDGNKPYVYAVADYGYTDGDTVVLDYQVPSLFVKYVWNKIFQENGFHWRYTGRGNRDDYNPFNNEQWDKLAFTISEGLEKPEESINPELKLTIDAQGSEEFNGRVVIPYTGQEITVVNIEGPVIDYVKFQSIFDPENLHITDSFGAAYAKSRIRIKKEGFYKFDISGFMYNNITESLGLYIERNGEDVLNINDDFPDGQTQFGETYKLYLRQGDEILIKIVAEAKEDHYYYAYDIDLNMWFDNTVNYVNFNSQLSKIKQKDFIKDIVNYFGLMYRKKGNVYEFISFEELLNPFTLYANYMPPQNEIMEDWSSKFHSVEKELTKIGDYAKNNRFKYKYIQDNDSYADGVIKVDDQTLDSENNLVERLFKAPDRSSVVINDKQLRFCDLYKIETDNEGNLKKVKPNKTKPFFFVIEKENVNLKYKEFDVNGQNVFTGIVPFMRFEKLDFNYVLPMRYASFSNMITYGKKYVVQMYLNSIDINRLDFFKLKYIKQLGGIFYLNKIKNFNAGKLTSVELIRIRTIERLGEFSDDFSNDFNI